MSCLEHSILVCMLVHVQCCTKLFLCGGVTCRHEFCSVWREITSFTYVQDKTEKKNLFLWQLSANVRVTAYSMAGAAEREAAPGTAEATDPHKDFWVSKKQNRHYQYQRLGIDEQVSQRFYLTGYSTKLLIKRKKKTWKKWTRTGDYELSSKIKKVNYKLEQVHFYQVNCTLK